MKTLYENHNLDICPTFDLNKFIYFRVVVFYIYKSES